MLSQSHSTLICVLLCTAALLHYCLQIETIRCTLGDRLQHVKGLVADVISPVLKSLADKGIVFMRDPYKITQYMIVTVHNYTTAATSVSCSCSRGSGNLYHHFTFSCPNAFVPYLWLCDKGVIYTSHSAS